MIQQFSNLFKQFALLYYPTVSVSCKVFNILTALICYEEFKYENNTK